MTTKEQAIISVYTGYVMCSYTDIHAYLEEKIGPFCLHPWEIREPELHLKLQDICREDFLALCSQKVHTS